MAVHYKVPFFSNAEDDLHCWQAVIKMIAKSFWPEKDFSWKELEEITGMEKNKWTWSLMGINWLAEQGVKLTYIDPFDYDRFIKEGGDYLISKFGEEVGRAQIENGNIPKEVETAKKLNKKINIEKRIARQTDIKRYLDQGYLIKVAVNSAALNNVEGYTGHAILIIGYDETGFLIHDPGLPAQENRKVDYELFEKSWAYPNETAKELLAVKKD